MIIAYPILEGLYELFQGVKHVKHQNHKMGSVRWERRDCTCWWSAGSCFLVEDGEEDRALAVTKQYDDAPCLRTAGRTSLLIDFYKKIYFDLVSWVLILEMTNLDILILEMRVEDEASHIMSVNSRLLILLVVQSFLPLKLVFPFALCLILDLLSCMRVLD
jgi:hypothetical protein